MPKTQLIRPFWALLLVFTVIRLVFGAQGVPYENTRIAAVSLLTLTLTCAALTAALARALLGYTLKDAAVLGALMGFSTQVVIFTATIGSILGGFSTYFNYAAAVDPNLPVGQPVPLAAALMARGGGLVVGSIVGAVAAAIGWTLGALVGRKG
jgi:hypothetical protein